MIGTLACGAVAPQPPAHLDAGHALDHPVEHDDIRGPFLGEKQSLVPVRSMPDLEAGAGEMPDEQLRQGRIVFYQEQASAGHSVATSPKTGFRSAFPKTRPGHIDDGSVTLL